MRGPWVRLSSIPSKLLVSAGDAGQNCSEMLLLPWVMKLVVMEFRLPELATDELGKAAMMPGQRSALTR